MKSMKRVVVTGMGAITPIGNSVEEFWSGVKEQKIGFAPITYFEDRKSTRLNSSHKHRSRMPSSA